MGGHIQKTNGGRWQIDFRDGNGRRHRATFDTRKEADKALTEVKTRVGRGDYVASKLIRLFARSPKIGSAPRAIGGQVGRELARAARSVSAPKTRQSATRSDRCGGHREIAR